jgi:hypothetical protein
VHLLEGRLQRRCELVGLELRDDRVVRREDRVEQRVRGDQHRQLRLEQLVISERVARHLEPRRHREALLAEERELVGREREAAGDQIEALGRRLVIPRDARQRLGRSAGGQDLCLVAPDIDLGDGARILDRGGCTGRGVRDWFVDGGDGLRCRRQAHCIGGARRDEWFDDGRLGRWHGPRRG